MSIRDALKKREEEREQKANAAQGPSDLPEGVSRYIRNSELAEGRTFIIMDDPDDWYFYYVHEDSSFTPRETYVKKHTCLHSPRTIGENFDKYAKPGYNVCPSCAAKVKRKLYFMIRLFDVEFGTWRIFDAKEYHAVNLINAYDKIEKTAKKFNKNYTLVGDVVVLKKADKTFTFESGEYEITDEIAAKVKEMIANRPDYADLANFRDVADVVNIVLEAADGHADKSAVAKFQGEAAKEEAKPIKQGSDDIDLPF